MTTHAFVNGWPGAATDERQGADTADLALLRLLADPLRLRVVTLLAAEQLCTCHLADATGALPTAVSNHLRQLREAGLVEREASGRYTYYRLRPGPLARVAEQLTSLAAAAGSATKRPC